MRQRIVLLVIALALAAPGAAITPWEAASLSRSIAQGSWETSEKLYRELKKGELSPEETQEVDYNLGVTLYEQKKYEEALGQFESVAKATKDDALRTKALYNQGNSLFRLERLEEAKKAYQEALLADPEDDDTRHNIEVILKKQKDQQQNQDKNQDKNQDQPQDEQNKTSDQKDDSQEQNSDQKDNGESSESEQNNPSDQQTPGDNAQDQKKPGQGKEEPTDAQQGEQKPLTEAEKKAAQEEAERARLLDYFRQQERDGRPATQMRAQAPPVRGKTW